MAGSTVVVGVVACSAILTIGLATAGAAAVLGQRLAGAADAAALAAADAASGAIVGEPCVRAEEIATALGVAVTACDLDLLTATVTVSAPFGHVTARASARAGPPP